MPRDALEVAFLAAVRPEPLLTVSEWSDAHRILPQKASSEPGPWRTGRTPYLRKILDCLSASSRYHTVVLAKGAQIGALHLHPCPGHLTVRSRPPHGDQHTVQREKAMLILEPPPIDPEETQPDPELTWMLQERRHLQLREVLLSC